MSNLVFFLYMSFACIDTGMDIGHNDRYPANTQRPDNVMFTSFFVRL